MPETVECLVCGKLFPRGPVDLARHQTAVTLQHLTSTTSSNAFQYSCRKCSLHFTTKEHLSLHSIQSSCKPSVKEKNMAALHSKLPTLTPKQPLTPPSDNAYRTITLPIGPGTKQLFKDGRTVECMVCGKTFPRGVLDLARHSQAVTLRHTYMDKMSSSYNFPCNDCGLYFPNDTFLEMHKEKSSCNPEVRKQIIDNQQAAELESQTRAAAATTASATSSPVQPKASTSICAATSTEGDSNSSAASESGGLRQSSRVKANVTVPEEAQRSMCVGGARRDTRKGNTVASHFAITKDSDTSIARNSAGVTGHITHSGFSTTAPASVSNANTRRNSSKREMALVDLLQHQLLHKRPRYIIPEERKTFYAIVSLLIDKDLWAARRSDTNPTTVPGLVTLALKKTPPSSGPGQTITAQSLISKHAEYAANLDYEKFIRPEHLPIVETLKTLLHFDC